MLLCCAAGRASAACGSGWKGWLKGMDSFSLMNMLTSVTPQPGDGSLASASSPRKGCAPMPNCSVLPATWPAVSTSAARLPNSPCTTVLMALQVAAAREPDGTILTAARGTPAVRPGLSRRVAAREHLAK
eukprot:COSAG02_NODE_2265_length_9290_cov_136.371628_3_plen_130_part_00